MSTNENIQSQNNNAHVKETHSTEYSNVKFDIIPYGEFIQMDIARPETSAPEYQRGAVWDKKFKALARDSILSGIPFPALIVCHVVIGDKELFLLIDGVQRTTVFESIYADFDNEANGEQLREQMDKYPVSVMTVTVDNEDTAAELFLRYNNGNKLTGIQKNRAGLSCETNATLKEYDSLCKAAGIKKFDTTAGIIAAAMCGEFVTGCAYRAGTGQKASNDLLASCDNVPEPNTAVKVALEAFGKLDADNKTEYTPNNKLVPFVVAVVRFFKTERGMLIKESLENTDSKKVQAAKDKLVADLVKFLQTLNTVCSEKIPVTHYKGKKTITLKEQVKHCIGEKHHSGSAKDTCFRFAGYSYLLKEYFTTDTEKEQEQEQSKKEQDAKKETADAIRNAMSF